MPEPNLPPLRVLLNGQHAIPDTKTDHVNVDCLRRKLPELPEKTREKLINQYGISQESAIILVVSISKLVSIFCLLEFCVYNLNSQNWNQLESCSVNKHYRFLKLPSICCMMSRFFFYFYYLFISLNGCVSSIQFSKTQIWRTLKVIYSLSFS